MRFELQVELDSIVYEYAIAFELPEGFKELRVLEERLASDGTPVYDRTLAQVHLAKSANGQEKDAKFRIDWHLVALPIVQEQSTKDPLSVFKQWLASMLILRPIPSLISADSTEETLQPNPRVSDFEAWFSGLLASNPAVDGRIDEYLRQVMPDLKDIKNPTIGKDFRSLVIQFANGNGSISVPFEDLSDCEKCFMICALVLAAKEAYGPLFCFWDEPDSHLALREAGQFVMSLRQAFQSEAQFVMTSHHEEAIRRFSDENTLVLHRNSHLEPTIVRRLDEMQIARDPVGALIRGDV